MIYLDYNATTPLCDAARDAMLPYLNRHYGNPSSIHAAGREARAAVDNARDKLAALLQVKSGEIIFTSGATESCNLAVFGLAIIPWSLASVLCRRLLFIRSIERTTTGMVVPLPSPVARSTSSRDATDDAQGTRTTSL